MIKKFDIIKVFKEAYIGLPGVGMQYHAGEGVMRIYYSDGGGLHGLDFWREVEETRGDPHIYHPRDGIVVISRYRIPPDREVTTTIEEFMLKKNFFGWVTPAGEFYFKKSKRTAFRLKTICHSLDLPLL